MVQHAHTRLAFLVLILVLVLVLVPVIPAPALVPVGVQLLTPVKVAPNVDMTCIRTTTWGAVHAAAGALKLLGFDAVVTSGCEGVHMVNSYHYKGYAFDMRSKHIPKKERPQVAEAILKALGVGWQVLEEHAPPHFHIERGLAL